MLMSGIAAIQQIAKCNSLWDQNMYLMEWLIWIIWGEQKKENSVDTETLSFVSFTIIITSSKSFDKDNGLCGD